MRAALQCLGEIGKPKGNWRKSQVNSNQKDALPQQLPCGATRPSRAWAAWRFGETQIGPRWQHRSIETGGPPYNEKLTCRGRLGFFTHPLVPSREGTDDASLLRLGLDFVEILLFFAEALGGARSVAPGEWPAGAGFGDKTHRGIKPQIDAKM